MSMVVDSQNYQHLFVVDLQNRVWATFDEGKTFTELTANLHTLTHDIIGRTIEFYDSPQSPNKDVLLVGAEGGVFEMKHFDRADAHWQLLGQDLPHNIVMDLHYDYTANLLISAEWGRGAWTLSNPFGDDGSNEEQQGNRFPDPNILAAFFGAITKEDPGATGGGATLVLQSGSTGSGQSGPNASPQALSGSTSATDVIDTYFRDLDGQTRMHRTVDGVDLDMLDDVLGPF
jgi:hypothetical protein